MKYNMNKVEALFVRLLESGLFNKEKKTKIKVNPIDYVLLTNHVNFHPDPCRLVVGDYQIFFSAEKGIPPLLDRPIQKAATTQQHEQKATT